MKPGKKIIKQKDDESGHARDLIEDLHMKIKATRRWDSVLLVPINIKLKKTKTWPELAWFRAAVGKSSPEEQVPARFSILRVDRAFTWALASFGESIFCLVRHETLLDPSS